MKVIFDEQGYVASFAIEGDLVGSVEVSDPADLDHFCQHFTAYRVRDGDLIFDDTQDQALATLEQTREYRLRREAECFSVINRGQLWYDTLTDAQRDELRQWYRSWLDGTSTLAVPERPAWLK